LTKISSRVKGITLIEILVIISMLAIIVSFAIPSVGGATARAEMEATVENVRFSLQSARNVARMTESSIAVNIENNPYDSAQKITFSSLGSNKSGKLNELQEYLLPAEIELLSDRESFVFDERGLVKEPGRIILASRADDSISAELDIE